MISRVINLVCSISLLLCLGATFEASAQNGWTIRNGGGGAELKFARVWRELGHQFAACTHPVNPCGFSPTTQKLISGLVKLRAECFATVGFASLSGSKLSQGACGETLTVNANALYRGETAISEVEMSVLALTILQQRSCEGLLSSDDFTQVVHSAASLRYFTTVEIGGTPYYVKNRATAWGDQLTVRVNALEVDVNGLIRSKYPSIPENMDYSRVVAFTREGKLDIRGEISLPGGKISHVFISFDPSLNIQTAFVYLR